jgi:hypothetical protein
MAAVPDAMVQMRRSGCLGDHCPAYSVSIFQDGSVVYEGRAHVAVSGVQRGSVSSEGLSALISQIDAVRFLDSASDCCVCSGADQTEIVVLDYRPGSIAKTIVHDAQCPSAPPGLRELEQAVDRVAGVERWTTGHPTAAESVP